MAPGGHRAPARPGKAGPDRDHPSPTLSRLAKFGFLPPAKAERNGPGRVPGATGSGGHGDRDALETGIAHGLKRHPVRGLTRMRAEPSRRTRQCRPSPFRGNLPGVPATLALPRQPPALRPGIAPRQRSPEGRAADGGGAPAAPRSSISGRALEAAAQSQTTYAICPSCCYHFGLPPRPDHGNGLTGLLAKQDPRVVSGISRPAKARVRADLELERENIHALGLDPAIGAFGSAPTRTKVRSATSSGRIGAFGRAK